MPLPTLFRTGRGGRLPGFGFHVIVPVFQHFLLFPLAVGFGLGALLGHPLIGLAIGLAIGSIWATVLTILLRRAANEAFNAPPPPGGWRKWDDDDDWDT